MDDILQSIKHPVVESTSRVALPALHACYVVGGIPHPCPHGWQPSTHNIILIFASLTCPHHSACLYKQLTVKILPLLLKALVMIYFILAIINCNSCLLFRLKPGQGSSSQPSVCSLQTNVDISCVLRLIHETLDTYPTSCPRLLLYTHPRHSYWHFYYPRFSNQSFTQML